jgi:hypothetical protein
LKRHTFGVMALSVLITYFALMNGLRLGEAIFSWKVLVKYGAPSIYICLIGGGWLIVGVFLVWSLWREKSWGKPAALVGTGLYTIWYWLDRLLFQKPHSNYLFVAIFDILIITLSFFVFFSSSKLKGKSRNDPYE